MLPEEHEGFVEAKESGNVLSIGNKDITVSEKVYNEVNEGEYIKVKGKDYEIFNF